MIRLELAIRDTKSKAGQRRNGIMAFSPFLTVPHRLNRLSHGPESLLEGLEPVRNGEEQ